MKNVQNTIILGAILGVLAGVFAPDYNHVYAFLGKAFITTLKYLVVPLVFSSLITGIISLGSVSMLRQMGGKTLIYFLITTTIAAVLGLTLALVIEPGNGFVMHAAADSAVQSPMSISEMIAQIIPSDFVGFMSGQNMLFLIIVSILIGILIVSFGNHITFPLDEFFEGVNDFMMVVTRWVIAFSPVGIFGLVGQLIVTTGAAAIIPLIKYMGVVLLGLVIYAGIVIPAILLFFVRCSPIAVARDVFPSLMTGFTTASSAAALPILMTDVQKKLKIPNKVASFVLPLGITINMDGTALFQCVATVFIAEIYGVALPFTSLVTIVVIAIFASIGAAAVPSAGIITLAMILSAVGIPIEGTGIIMGVDRLLDMCRTSVNLWSNTAAAGVVTRWCGKNAFEDGGGEFSN
jgi:proton glutamate symport protein